MEKMENQTNLFYWEKFRVVPENAQRPIADGKLKGKTDINPVWRLKVLTDAFGPCGMGWHYVTKERWTDTFNGELVANVRIELYIHPDGGTAWPYPIEGIGGSKIFGHGKGQNCDDEAWKMATTDAISVACKSLGIAADIYFAKDAHQSPARWSKYDTPGYGEPRQNQQRGGYQQGGYQQPYQQQPAAPAAPAYQGGYQQAPAYAPGYQQQPYQQPAAPVYQQPAYQQQTYQQQPAAPEAPAPREEPEVEVQTGPVGKELFPEPTDVEVQTAEPGRGPKYSDEEIAKAKQIASAITIMPKGVAIAPATYRKYVVAAACNVQTSKGESAYDIYFAKYDPQRLDPERFISDVRSIRLAIGGKSVR